MRHYIDQKEKIKEFFDKMIAENYNKILFRTQENRLRLKLPIKIIPESSLFLKQGRCFVTFFHIMTTDKNKFNEKFLDYENNPVPVVLNYSPHRISLSGQKNIGMLINIYKENDSIYIAEFEIYKEFEHLVKTIVTDMIVSIGEKYEATIVEYEDSYQWEKGKPEGSKIYFTISRNDKYLEEVDLCKIQEKIDTISEIEYNDHGIIEMVNYSSAEQTKTTQKEIGSLKTSVFIKDEKIIEPEPLVDQQILTWHQYFMGIAIISSMRSKDPKRKVGAVIVDNDHRILSIGYNGFPNHCNDKDFPWNDEPERSNTDQEKIQVKDFYVVHAELNAILNYKGESLKGSTIYTTLIPCNECIKAIIQSGIKKIIYKDYKESYKNLASKRMIEAAGIEMISYGSLKDSKTTILFKL